MARWGFMKGSQGIRIGSSVGVLGCRCFNLISELANSSFRALPGRGVVSGFRLSSTSNALTHACGTMRTVAV